MNVYEAFLNLEHNLVIIVSYMTIAETDIPYFVKIRGCINCSASKAYKTKTGHDYGFDHEIVAGCLIRSCVEFGHNLGNPYIDPQEIARMTKKLGDPEALIKAKEIIAGLQTNYGNYYEALGIDISKILQDLS